MDIQELKDFINSYDCFHCKTEGMVYNYDKVIKSSSIKIEEIMSEKDLYIVLFSGDDIGISATSSRITNFTMHLDGICDECVIINCKDQKIKLVAHSW